MKHYLAVLLTMMTVALAATPMFVVGEVFTEVCGGCGGDYSVARSALIQLSQEYERLIPVIWQHTAPQSPGADDRYNWYGGTEFPYAVFGGNIAIAGEYDPLNDYYDAYMQVFEQESPLEITLTMERTESNDVYLHAGVQPIGSATTADNRAFFLLTKHDRSNYHGLVVAMSDPGSIDLDVGYVERETTFEWDNSWDETVLRGVLIVQSYDTGEILQAALAKFAVDDVEDDDTPQKQAAALRAYPNPFTPSTAIALELSSAERNRPVSLSVYDARGRLVRTLLAGERTLREEVAWDGRDDDNRTVASGVYFAVLQTAQRRSAVKLALLK